MNITTKTSPQGVAIEYVEYERAITQGRLHYFRTMIQLQREAANRRNAKQAPKQVQA